MLGHDSGRDGAPRESSQSRRAKSRDGRCTPRAEGCRGAHRRQERAVLRARRRETGPPGTFTARVTAFPADAHKGRCPTPLSRGAGPDVLPDRQGGGVDRFSRPAPDCGQPPRTRSPLLASRAEVLRPRPRPIARHGPTRGARGGIAQTPISTRVLAGAAPGVMASAACDCPRSTRPRPRMDTLRPAHAVACLDVAGRHTTTTTCTGRWPVGTGHFAA